MGAQVLEWGNSDIGDVDLKEGMHSYRSEIFEGGGELSRRGCIPLCSAIL